MSIHPSHTIVALPYVHLLVEYECRACGIVGDDMQRPSWGRLTQPCRGHMEFIDRVEDQGETG